MQKDDVITALENLGGMATLGQAEFTHAFYQGVIAQIGNIRNFATFVPAQDKCQVQSKNAPLMHTKNAPLKFAFKGKL